MSPEQFAFQGRETMKGLSPVLVALAAVGMMPASGADAQTIALFTKNNTNPFSQAIRIGSNAAAVALGVKVVHYVPTTPDNVVEQTKLVEDAIRNKPDAIIFDPVDNEKLVPAIEKINAADIPVTEVTDRSVGGKFVSRVLPDDYQIALALARRLFKEMGGKGSVVILEGIAGNVTNTERLKGFNDAIKETAGVKLLASKSGNYQRRPAQDVMEGFIKSFAQIDGVLAANDSMAAAVTDTLEKRGRKALVVGINGSKEAIELIKNGKMLASGEFNGFVLGCLSTELAALNLRKQPVPHELVLKPAIYDKTNYEKFEQRVEMKKCPTMEEVAAQ
jgi:ribose transport system substrate-binding protein